MQGRYAYPVSSRKIRNVLIKKKKVKKWNATKGSAALILVRNTYRSTHSQHFFKFHGDQGLNTLFSFIFT